MATQIRPAPKMVQKPRVGQLEGQPPVPRQHGIPFWERPGLKRRNLLLALGLSAAGGFIGGDQRGVAYERGEAAGNQRVAVRQAKAEGYDKGRADATAEADTERVTAIEQVTTAERQAGAEAGNQLTELTLSLLASQGRNTIAQPMLNGTVSIPYTDKAGRRGTQVFTNPPLFGDPNNDNAGLYFGTPALLAGVPSYMIMPLDPESVDFATTAENERVVDVGLYTSAEAPGQIWGAVNGRPIGVPGASRIEYDLAA